MGTARNRARLCPPYPFLQLVGADHFTVDSIRRSGTNHINATAT
jgi:hypothetical protein